MRKIKALAIFNAISFLIHLAVTWAVQMKQVNNLDVSEVSRKFETLFTPAGITFAIWGIIYSLLLLLCLYHIVIAYKHDKNHPANAELMKMGSAFMIVNLASAAWLIAWTQEQIAMSGLLIFIQLVGLIIIHARLGIYNPHKIAALKLVNQFPLSIYLGWISIATIANISSYLTSIEWNMMDLTAVQWTTVMICVAVVLASLMIVIRRNIYFGLVVMWGLYGIITKRQQLGEPDNSPINLTAWAGIGLIALLAVIQLIRNIKHRVPRPVFPSPEMPIK